MNRSVIPLILLLITATVFTSGCETRTADQTWGEKKIDLSLIQEAKNTTAEHYEYDGKTYFFLEGYLFNGNPFDALDVNLTATFYDSQGNVAAVSDKFLLEPKTIPSNGYSYFYFEALDPEKKIVTYKVDVLGAKAQYLT